MIKDGKFVIKLPEYFSLSIEQQIATQVATAVRYNPDVKAIVCYTYTGNKNKPFNKFALDVSSYKEPQS